VKTATALSAVLPRCKRGESAEADGGHMSPSLSHLEYAQACHDARVAGSREAHDHIRLARPVTREPFARRLTR
jgi:hypothetical protein